MSSFSADYFESLSKCKIIIIIIIIIKKKINSVRKPMKGLLAIHS